MFSHRYIFKFHIKNRSLSEMYPVLQDDLYDRRVSQMLALLTACRELAVDYNTSLNVFEHKA